MLEIKSKHPKSLNQTVLKEVFNASLRFKYPNITPETLKKCSKLIDYEKEIVHKIDYCSNNCLCFINENENLINCNICGEERFRKCNRGSCSSKTYKECNHYFKYRTARTTAYYISSLN